MSDFLNKAEEFATKHDKQVDEGLERAGDEVDKRTGGRYASEIDKGVDQAQQRTGDGDHSDEAQPR